MYIKIHRGTQQIGGNIIEIGTAKTKLLFDAGANLPPLDDSAYRDSIEIEGLTCGVPSFDAVFVSHHHNDHCGLLERILPDIPMWSGYRETEPVQRLLEFCVEQEIEVVPLHCGGYGQIFATNRDINVVTCSIDIAATKVTAEITFVRRNYFFTWFLLCSLYNEVSEKRRGLSRKVAKIIFYFFRFT
ncbi:MAG: hypothetical protein RR423_06310 [Hydrogenoanaerobacterium sp.]